MLNEELVIALLLDVSELEICHADVVLPLCSLDCFYVCNFNLIFLVPRFFSVEAAEDFKGNPGVNIYIALVVSRPILGSKGCAQFQPHPPLFAFTAWHGASRVDAPC